MANRYLGHLESRGYSPGTVRAYAFDVLNFSRLLPRSGWRHRRCHADGLFDYLDWQARPVATATVVRLTTPRGAAPATVNRRVAAVRGLFEFAVICGLRADNPVPAARRSTGMRARPRGLLGHVGTRREAVAGVAWSAKPADFPRASSRRMCRCSWPIWARTGTGPWCLVACGRRKSARCAWPTWTWGCAGCGWWARATGNGSCPWSGRSSPAAVHLFTTLRPVLRDLIPDDARYEDTFDWFEYLHGLVVQDLDTQGHRTSFRAPVGCFGWRHKYWSPDDGGDSVGGELSKIIDGDTVTTEPIAAGMFGGDLERYRNAADSYGDRQAGRCKLVLGDEPVSLLVFRRGFRFHPGEVRHGLQFHERSVVRVLEDAFERGESTDDRADVVGFLPGCLPDECLLYFPYLLGFGLPEVHPGRGGTGDFFGELLRELGGDDDPEPKGTSFEHERVEAW